MESIAVTDIGSRREISQGYVYCNDYTVGLLPNLYIVADGMGGHKAGDFASRFSVTEFEKELKELKGRTIIGSMEGSIRQVNEKLLKEAEAEPDYEGMGTTFVAACIDKEVELEAGDYVLLCSDGLTNMVEDGVIKDAVLNPDNSLQEKADYLIKLANENGGRDNISLVLVHI